MAFVLSKLLWTLLSPANLLVLLLLIGFGAQMLGWRRFGLRLSAGVLAVLTALTMLPVWAWTMVPLESRFPQPVWPEKIDGVVVLGGSVDTSASAAWNRPVVNHAADRLMELAWLARRYPEARLVFTGGSGSLTNPEQLEAPIVRRALERIGVPVERMVFEDRSRNTLENAVFTKELVKPKPGETWVLVTSAYHMPRSVGIFRKIGWPVLPDPVAYYTGLDDGSQFGPNLAKDLSILDDSLHEWLGLVSYRLMGRTDALFPGPN